MSLGFLVVISSNPAREVAILFEVKLGITHSFYDKFDITPTPQKRGSLYYREVPFGLSNNKLIPVGI
jgi:hypothetical protein